MTQEAFFRIFYFFKMKDTQNITYYYNKKIRKKKGFFEIFVKHLLFAVYLHVLIRRHDRARFIVNHRHNGTDERIQCNITGIISATEESGI